MLLAALASGSQVRVEPDNHHLTRLLHDEIDAVAVHRRPPLALYDVSAPDQNEDRGDARDGSGTGPIRPFKRALSKALENALWGTRENATIQIVHPQSGNTIDRRSCQGAFNDQGSVASLHVEVQLTAFRLPDDGMWCVNLGGTEIACVGDKRFDIDVPLPRSACFDDATGSPVVRLEAVLKGELDPPVVVRRSAVVELSVV